MIHPAQRQSDTALSLLIKPVSADCNLACEYCFYLEKSKLYDEVRHHRMSVDVLERLVASYMQTEQPVYSFGWQGGEPTIMGVSFFERVVELQQRYGQPGSVVANGLQTNATLIDESLASLFSKYRFLLGCSLDGPAEIHDLYRRNRGDKPSYSSVINGIQELRNAGVQYNILVLVSQANIKSAREIYRYLVGNGHFFHQYIPCVEFDEEGALQPFAVTGEEWGRFLCELFDEWYQTDIRRVSIRHFDAVLAKIVDGKETVCTIGQNCCQYLVVEYNGDVYPCDFFVESDKLLGNIMTHSWEDLLNSSQYFDFGAQKRLWNSQCDGCECLDLCNGDCLKHRLYSGNPPQNISWLCSGWKSFYGHSRERFNQLAEMIIIDRRSIGRNTGQKKSRAKTIPKARSK